MSNTIINTNVLALNSHRALKGVGGTVAKSSERLSSGMRINRAADDAAGLAISEKMRSQIRGLDQATRNSQDGISLIQTAEGALQETQNMLQRMRELTVQASNETNTASDRDKIAGEIDQIVEEIDATAGKTEFNTKKLIDGSWKNSTIYLQTGANNSQGLEFNIDQMDSITLGTTKGTISSVIRGSGVDSITAIEGNKITDKDTSGILTFADGATIEIMENGDLKVSGMKLGANATDPDAESFYSAADALGKTFNDGKGGTIAIAADGTIDITEAVSDAAYTLPEALKDVTTEVTVGTVKIAVTPAGDKWGTAGEADVTFNFKDLNGVTFLDANGEEIKFEAGKDYAGDHADIAKIASMIDRDGNKFAFTAAKAIFNTPPVKNISFIASNDASKQAVEDLAVTGQASGKVISGLTEKIDKAIENVSSQRANLGAYQNRLEYTINNLQTSSENLSASESRIRDTDMAKEMMNMTKANVLQQAATSMLAQANQAPQAILKLLG